MTDEQIEKLSEQFIDYGDGDTEQTIIDVLGFGRAILQAATRDELEFHSQGEVRRFMLDANVDGVEQFLEFVLAKEHDALIHDLETRCDPAGLVQENGLLRDQTRQLDAMIGRLKTETQDAMDTLVAVLNAIGYTEEFASTHPDLKVSEGVKLFLATPSDTEHDELKCDSCGAETPDPWHTSDATRKHLHECDACHAAPTQCADARPGTPLARLEWLLKQLATRFPEAEEPYSSAPCEPRYLAAIDALITERGADARPVACEALVIALRRIKKYVADSQHPQWAAGRQTEFSLARIEAIASAALATCDATPVVDAREALTDSVVEQWLDRKGNDSGQGLCDMYTSAVRDGYRLARSTLTDFYATRDAAPSDAPNAWADLWYFVMDEAPMEFERIVTTVSPKQWHSEAHKLMRAKYPIAPREKT